MLYELGIASLVYLVIFSIFSHYKIIDLLQWLSKLSITLVAVFALATLFISVSCAAGELFRETYKLVFSSDPMKNYHGGIWGMIGFTIVLCMYVIMVKRVIQKSFEKTA